MHRIMVVDDSMVIRNKIKNVDGNGQFHVICQAKNGLEAIKLCKQYQPDIVTMDLTMPEMDGLEAIPKLLEIDPDLDILIISALSDQATGLEALELGASGFLTKPFSEMTLRKALMEFIEYDED